MSPSDRSGCGLKDPVEGALREAVPDPTQFVIEESAVARMVSFHWLSVGMASFQGA